MNILLLSSSLRQGGAETHVFELARSLSARGHRITVATAGGALADELGEYGIKHVKMPLDSKSPLAILHSTRRLHKLAKEEQFDVIHTHSRIAAFVCRIAFGGKDTRIVSTVHSHFKTTPLLRRLSFWGNRSIAVSEDLSNYLCREYKISPRLVSVIPNGIDTDKFSPSDTPNNSAPRILFASRLDTDCSLGALLLCRIAKKLAEHTNGLEIHIAGGGKELRRLFFLAKKVNAELGYECIRLCGYIKNMPDALKAADVFVGVSRAALEAMSSAVPTVLCGNEGFVGILDSSNIDLAESTNFCCRGSELPTSIALYDAISTILNMKKSERAELGKYLRGYVLAHHSLSSLAERTLNFYLSATCEKRDGGIVVCGYYGAGNLGDDAMLGAIIKKLRARYPEKPICVVSCRREAIINDVGSVSRKDLITLRKKIKSSSLLVLGGGSILQDKSSLRSLVFYTSLIKYAHKCGVRVELLANGLGPLKRRISKRLAKKALFRCSKITLRDELSRSLAILLGAPKHLLELEEDLSSYLDPCDSQKAQELIKTLSLDGKKFALVGIKGKDKPSVKRKIKRCIASLCDKKIAPLFVVMHSKEDKKSALRLSKKYGGAVAEGLSPEELCGIIPLAELAIGTRYHLLYLAKRSGVPIIGFGNDPKILGL